MLLSDYSTDALLAVHRTRRLLWLVGRTYAELSALVAVEAEMAARGMK